MKHVNYATLLHCRTGQKYGSRRLNDPSFNLFLSFFRLDFPRDELLSMADFFFLITKNALMEQIQQEET